MLVGWRNRAAPRRWVQQRALWNAVEGARRRRHAVAMRFSNRVGLSSCPGPRRYPHLGPVILETGLLSEGLPMIMKDWCTYSIRILRQE